MVNMLHPVLEDIARLKNTTKEKPWNCGILGLGSLMNGKKSLLWRIKKNSLLNDELESCSFDDSDEDTIVAVDDEQYNLFLPKKTKEDEDLMDNGFENFNKKEGPK